MRQALTSDQIIQALLRGESVQLQYKLLEAAIIKDLGIIRPWRVQQQFRDTPLKSRMIELRDVPVEKVEATVKQALADAWDIHEKWLRERNAEWDAIFPLDNQ